MKHNEFTPIGKFCTTLLIALVVVSAISNIANGVVGTPTAFWIAVAGFACFAIAKLSVIAGGKWASFGPSRMSEGTTNLYRVGY